jgi:hypothetical protein
MQSSASTAQTRTLERKPSGSVRPWSESQTGIIDVFGTSHCPAGPWPNASDGRLLAWIKLEREEYMCKRHDSPVDRIEDWYDQRPIFMHVPCDVHAHVPCDVHELDVKLLS